MNQETGMGILRSAGVMGIATFFSRILGLIREQAFAFLFGATHAMDAFNIAFRIPNLLRDLFAEGAMSTALVPVFTQVKTKEGEQRAWRIASLVIKLLVVLTCVLALLGIVFSKDLVWLYASAYQKIPGKFELTVQMTQVIFPFFPLIVLAAAFMGSLNACGYFFIPAFAPALFNLTSLLVGVPLVMIFNKINLPPILGMAIGVLVGGFVQAFSQLPSLLKAGYRVSTKTDQDLVWYQEPALKKMLLLMLPGMVGLAATQVNFLINSILATSQEAGAVSWLNYAFRLMQFPIGIFGVSLALASLPLISQEWVNENFSNVSQTVDQTLKRVFAINLPCSMAFIFLSYPIVELIYQYGMFSADSTRHTAYALCAYSVGLTAYSCVKTLVPVFYAMGNTRYPVISSVLSVVLTIIFNLLMIRA
ncbi:MAG: murein biosynthesis integral membrane protein MurJ, partial [Bdellovibrio sp.]|nr:murein biosynthesis integral membrane protein MurJ [Bdellovibrio sp.]